MNYLPTYMCMHQLKLVFFLQEYDKLFIVLISTYVVG